MNWYHAGELAIQARFGAQERMEKQGRRVIREYFPEQHRQFFAQPFYLIIDIFDAFSYT
ncbi:probable iron-sulfur binding protein YPO1417 [Richelia intracellularis]|nr:probable iron-sulfur binding protein YPO1417 [Richelia intracellularis]